MTDKEKPLDQAAEDELKGVPEHLRDGGEEPEDSLAEALELLKRDLENAKQDVLYAQAETQNVRRRLEREKDERAPMPRPALPATSSRSPTTWRARSTRSPKACAPTTA